MEKNQMIPDMDTIKKMLSSEDMKVKIKAFRYLCMEKFEANQEVFVKANASIEKYRKGDCSICFTDKDGVPVSGKKVRVVQKNHDFKYGANMLLLDEFKT